MDVRAKWRRLPSAIPRPEIFKAENKCGLAAQVFARRRQPGTTGNTLRLLRQVAPRHVWKPSRSPSRGNGEVKQVSLGCEGGERLLKFHVCWDAAVCAPLVHGRLFL